MILNCLAAAVRVLARSRTYSAISIFGLAVGIAAALLVALVIRNQLRFDAFIPGYERTYLAISELTPLGHAPVYDPISHEGFGRVLKLKYREIDAYTRLLAGRVELRRGEVAARERIYWADANALDVLPLPTLYGDADAALRKPDGLVLTRGAAKKYFGRADPLGETLLLDKDHPMTVRAVIEDLPANGTTLESGILASGLAAYSPLAKLGEAAPNPDSTGFAINVRTYLRLAPGASIETVRTGIPGLLKSYMPKWAPGLSYTVRLERLDRVHLLPGLNPGISARLTMFGVVGALILLIACVNFVNLSTAHAARRALEVGVRKVTGAGKTALLRQFLGEALVQVLAAACLAIAMVELILPHANAFLDAGAAFDLWRTPWFIAAAALSLLGLTLLAGLYPAFVLSSFRPAGVLKGLVAHSRFAAGLRRLLVVSQFAILIVLLIAAAVVYRQQVFATRDSLRVETDQVVLIRGRCNDALKTEIRRLPGVVGAYCSGNGVLTALEGGVFKTENGQLLTLASIAMEFGALNFFGVRPIAGRLPQQENGEVGADARRGYAINQTAVQRLGFSSPGAALGHRIESSTGDSRGDIVAVVPDFSFASIEKPIEPTLYFVAPRGRGAYGVMHVKLTGKDIPETLAAIDRLWVRLGNTDPIQRVFLEAHIQNLYLSLLRQAQAFLIFSGIAVVLACLGLAALSASATDRRTKEIGIRKSMGASRRDITGLLLRDFTKPVLLANLIAWPLAYWAMSRWLNGFAYHIDLEPWMFIGAGAVALTIAAITVLGHALRVARAKPVQALRYE
jgi:putative ABC transport system permease protein